MTNRLTVFQMDALPLTVLLVIFSCGRPYFLPLSLLNALVSFVILPTLLLASSALLICITILQNL